MVAVGVPLELQRPPMRDSWFDRIRFALYAKAVNARFRARNAEPRSGLKSAGSVTPGEDLHETDSDDWGSEDAPGIEGPGRQGSVRRHAVGHSGFGWARAASYLITAVVSIAIGLAISARLSTKATGSVSRTSISESARTASTNGAAPLAELPIITAAPGPSTTTTTVLIVVHAAGAFKRPGVYLFPLGARVDDLLTAAGGVQADAQTDLLNLAAPLSDGQRVWVPVRGQPIPSVAPADVAPAVSPASGSGAGPNGTGSSGQSSGAATVSLNSATAEQLDALPGVGPATAAAIIEYRTSHQKFRSVAELLNVPGIGEAKLAAIKARVTL